MGKILSTDYYIKSPNGRRKIKPTPINDEDAIAAFNADWTATSKWACDGQRVLVKETREELVVEKVSKYVG